VTHRFRPLAAGFIALLFCLVLGGAAVASLDGDYQSAVSAFRALEKDARADGRAQWEDLARRFQRIYQADPQGGYAPKALFFLGRVYEEMGRRGHENVDLLKSCEYFQRVVSRFPGHSWADDALLRKAQVTKDDLGRPDEAYADLLLLTHNYAGGDMRAEADALLASMDHAKSAKPAPKTAPAPGLTAGPILAQGAASGAEAPAKGLLDSGSSGQAPSSGTARLEQVRFQSSNDYTRIVLSLDQETAYSWGLLSPHKDPGISHPRLFLDLRQTRLDRSIDGEIAIADGILNRVRSGQHDADTARVVLDFDDLQDYKIFSLYDPFRVIVDVYAHGRAEIASAEDAAPPAPATAAPEPKAVAKPAAKGPIIPTGKDSRKLAGDLVEQLGLTVNTVMIDAGHGGKDPGARANGIEEKDVTLRLALIVGQKLTAAGFKVLYTRTNDTFIPLEERTAMANVRKADMFLSIHCNATRDKSVSGLETYSLNLAKSEDAVRVAARENAVSAKRISDLQVILTDLMLNSKVKESKDLAGEVQSGTLTGMRKKYGLRDRRVREAPFYVLMGAKMPSILVEVGYITNAAEAKRLTTKTYLDSLADGIVQGVVSYKRQIERYASL
jgi:N-acetylmuramoyl-L-alanine amidase